MLRWLSFIPYLLRDEPKKPLMGLFRTCVLATRLHSIISLRVITPFDLAELRTLAPKLLRRLYKQQLCTAASLKAHLLLHIAESIEVSGPPRFIDTKATERQMKAIRNEVVMSNNKDCSAFLINRSLLTAVGRCVLDSGADDECSHTSVPWMSGSQRIALGRPTPMILPSGITLMKHQRVTFFDRSVCVPGDFVFYGSTISPRIGRVMGFYSASDLRAPASPVYVFLLDCMLDPPNADICGGAYAIVRCHGRGHAIPLSAVFAPATVCTTRTQFVLIGGMQCVP